MKTSPSREARASKGFSYSEKLKKEYEVGKRVDSVKWYSSENKLAFITIEGTSTTLQTLELDTESIEVLPVDEGNIISFTFSVDGKSILYHRSASRENGYARGMFIVSTDLSGAPIKITDIVMVNFSWSSDGRNIVYSTVGAPGNNELNFFTFEAGK